MNESDHQLLTAYARGGSEAAFTELVHRHAGMVRAAALRQTRNPHLADEVTQAVFVSLARKAGSLSRKTVVLGWLLQATRYASIDAVRAEVRRQRKHAAFTMNPITDGGVRADDPDDEHWERVAPVLDEGIHRLSAQDRDALILRFFQGQSLAQVGAALGIAEEAARKRVHRAVERLRGHLTRLGAATTPALLPTLLQRRIQTPVRPDLDLVQSVTEAAIQALPPDGGLEGLVRTILRRTLVSRLQPWLAATGLVVAVSAGATWVRNAGVDRATVALPANGDYAVAGFPDPQVVHRFVAAFQDALRSGDAAAVARHMRFPLTVNTPQGSIRVPDGLTFAEDFRHIVPIPTLSLILKSPGERLHADVRGVMVADGAVWIAPEPGSAPPVPKVSALNIR